MNYLKKRFRTDNQDFINFALSSLSYIVFAVILGTTLSLTRNLPHTIDTLDLILILFATLRLTEFFVYDKSMQFFRDLFVRIEKTKAGEVKKTPTPYGVRRTVHDLLSCPWCTSVWTATVVVFIYYLIPNSWIFIAIIAISGMATIIQIGSNMIGWTSEKTELEVKKENED